MLERMIEFAINHWGLVATFFGCLIGVLVLEGKRAGINLGGQQVTNLINRESAVVVDIRERKDFDAGHITESINMPYATFKDRIGELNPHKDKPVVLVCKMGQHSGSIGKQLAQAGFKKVFRLQGGIAGWQGENLPLVKS